jgi:glycosidase
MHWSAEANGGFCPSGARPWLPVHPNHADGVNVADQLNRAGSLLSHYRALLKLRRESPALVGGDYTPLQSDDPDLLVFLRATEEQTCLVALNFSGSAAILEPAPALPYAGRVLMDGHRREGVELALPGLAIAPFELLICET